VDPFLEYFLFYLRGSQYEGEGVKKISYERCESEKKGVVEFIC